MDATAQSRSSVLLAGTLCGVGASLSWAIGFVAAKHGVLAGFSPADLAFHRFFWSGLLLAPFLMRDGFGDLGGIGWPRGLIMCVLGGAPQAIIAYSAFVLVPLNHGATIQPACSALFGILFAALLLRERMSGQRIGGAVTIIAGLVVFGVESFSTIGQHGVAGDLLSATAGLFWGTFGVLVRAWNIPAPRAAVVVAPLSALLLGPLYFLFFGYGDILRMGLAENLLQVAVQGVFAGVLPIYLFSRAVLLLGAGRASTFPALVPVFSVVIGFLALGVAPTMPQIIGLAIVLVGFRFALKP